MNIGVVLPQTEIGNDPAAIKAYAEAVEDMGFTHILVFDHVLGANPERPGGWKGAVYLSPRLPRALRSLRVPGRGHPPGWAGDRHHHPAAAPDRAGGQAGRGGGRALGRPPAPRRGRGLEPGGVRGAGRGLHHPRPAGRGAGGGDAPALDARAGHLQGAHHRISDAGLNPLPVQRPIPVWMGGESEPVQKRMARVADGWMPHFRPGETGQAVVDRLHGMIREAGRDQRPSGSRAA